jgi:uncharacterized protein (TIGR02001 family)
MNSKLRTSLLALMLVAPGTALAGDDAIGLNLDLGVASAYLFRGFNVFQEDGQMNQNAMVAPGLTYAVGDTGLSVGYWGAFQVLGSNIGANIDGALGAEQDLYASYDMALNDALSLSAGLCYYFYPLADADMNGASVPSYLEPAVSLGWAGPVDVSLGAAYFWGVQDQPGIRGISYLYVPVSVGKSLSLSDSVGLDLSAGYGFKLWKGGNDGAANVHDVLIGAGVPIALGERAYLAPAVNAAWTDLGDLGIGDELAVFGGLNVGVDL